MLHIQEGDIHHIQIAYLMQDKARFDHDYSHDLYWILFLSNSSKHLIDFGPIE